MSERTGAKRVSIEFADECTTIAARYARRTAEPRKERYSSPGTNAAGDLRVRVYKLGRRIGVRSQFGGLGINTFQVVLLRVFAELGMTTKNDRNRARLIAKELRYADESDVPSKYLIGFIHQVGGRKRIERLQAATAAVKPTTDKRGRGDARARSSRKRVTAPRRRRLVS